MNTLVRARYLILYYEDLQGYRLLPFAAFFALVALLRLVLDSPVAPAGLAAAGIIERWFVLQGGSMALFIAAALVSGVIGRRYEDLFGAVEMARGVPRAFSPAKWLVGAVLWTGGNLLGGFGWLAVLLLGISPGTWKAVIRLRLERRLRHIAGPDVRLPRAPVSFGWVYILLACVFANSLTGIGFDYVHMIDIESGPNLYNVVWRSLAASLLLAWFAVYNHGLLVRHFGQPAVMEEGA